MKAEKICVLASGGADSSIILWDFCRRGFIVYPLYIRNGYSWEKAELAWLRRLLKRLGHSRLRPLSVLEAFLRDAARDHWGFSRRHVPPAGSAWTRVYLPGRNLVLLSLAGLFCSQRGIKRLILGTLKGNPFKDTAPGFLKLMEKSTRAALGHSLRIETPYAGLTKKQAVARAPEFPLKLTFSCLNPRGEDHCGVCSKCEERSWVLADSGKNLKY